MIDNPRLSLKICVICGVSFFAGHTAKYCHSCKDERLRQQHREYIQRKKAGKNRVLGSTYLCLVCGKPYIVCGAIQKYCKTCSVVKKKESDRASFARRYYGDDPVKKERMKAVIRKWESEHKERRKVAALKWESEHKERRKEGSHQRYLANREQILERDRIRKGLKLNPLGRIETCPTCNKSFVVTRRNQKYCFRCGQSKDKTL